METRLAFITSGFRYLSRWLSIDAVFTSLLLMLIAGFLAFSGLLNRIDALTFDLGRYLAAQSAPRDVVIVAIDEKSLSQIGRWPWSRHLHAELLNQIAQEEPLAIGLDIIFAEPDLAHANDFSKVNADTHLENAIKKAGNVVLPVLFEVPFAGSALKLSLPLPQLAAASAALGRVHVPLDIDGLARGIYLQEILQNHEDVFQKLNGISQTHIDHGPFAAALLRIAAQLPTKYAQLISTKQSASSLDPSSSQINRDAYRLINFIGPPNHFQRISYLDVLIGHYPKQYFKNKIVLVGATAIGLGDVLPTSVSAKSQPMPGVEFHAHVLEAMRTDQLITPLSTIIVVIGSMLLASIPVLWLRRISPFLSLLWCFIYFSVIILLALVMAHYGQYWFPPASVLVAIILAYPLWSWRKLESAQRYLDHELQLLQAELSSIGAETRFLAVTGVQDSMQSRISKVQQTAEKLRSLHHERQDTLAFISHDLRAPLGSAMMLLEDTQDHHVARARQMLGQAHAMAEQFLQTSRAEMASPVNFKTIDLISLIQQVHDDVYLDAKQKSLSLHVTNAMSEVWVLGDFGLLQRAFTNIYLNAIKYAPIGSVIQTTISRVDAAIQICVTDYGPGIPADKIPRLFKRYSRAEGQQQAASGTGLGLYFVHTVLTKHGGNVVVESQTVPDKALVSPLTNETQSAHSFTTFKLLLPISSL